MGVDNIDLDAATHRGVVVMNTPGRKFRERRGTCAGADAVAGPFHPTAQRCDARRPLGESRASAGAELRGKTLGLVGLGRVGAEVARRARGFEMRVLAHDPYLSPERAAEWGVELRPAEDLLAQSDFVSLHTGLSAATQGMINAETIAQMKRGARLINTARGELVDEAALADALRSGPSGRSGARRVRRSSRRGILLCWPCPT